MSMAPRRVGVGIGIRVGIRVGIRIRIRIAVALNRMGIDTGGRDAAELPHLLDRHLRAFVLGTVCRKSRARQGYAKRQ